LRAIFPPLLLLALLVTGSTAQEEYTFDLAEVEKKSVHFGGYLEFRPVLFRLDQDSWLHKLKFYDSKQGKSLAQYNFNSLLDLSYDKGMVFAKIRTNTDLEKSYSGWSFDTDLFEAFISLKPSLSFHIDAGKLRMRWGKGYAWNPVAFFDRPKNPSDPELALEGVTVLTMDYIRSFPGALKTITFTPVLLPVYDHINGDFGERNKLNFGGKVYLLLYDTDIDIMFMAGESVPGRVGADISRNLASNFELHGELAYIPDYEKTVLSRNGSVTRKTYASTSYLLGMRYLSPKNLTLILEYYRNGNGYTSSEMGDVYYLVEQAYEYYLQTGDDSRLNSLAGAATQAYQTFAPMQDYLYLQASQKEPWDILYFVPSIFGIFNLTDNSFTLTPQMLYSPITNLELRARVTILVGKGGSEFGEKQNDFRLEFRGRYYF
jgi:hypothetical protein